MTAKYVTPPTPGRRNYATGVGAIARGMGTPLMPWQQQYVTVQTEILDDNSWAYGTTIGTVPRQAGKTTARGPIAIHRCLIKPRSRCWLTAQTRQDARDIIVDGVGPRFKGSPLGRLGVVRRSQGSEGIILGNGSSWRAFSPNDTNLHGTTNELVDVDEPWAHDPVTGAAIEAAAFPTFTTTGGQFGLLGTAGTAASTWFYGYILAGREAVLSGRNTGTAIVEYGLADDLVDQVRDGLMHEKHSPEWITAVKLIVRDHPAYGYTLRPDAVYQAAERLSPDEMLRAYGNIWTEQLETVIPTRAWTGCQTDRVPAPAGRTGFGVAAGVGREDLAVVEFWRDHNGRGFARVRHHQPNYDQATHAIATHCPPGHTATAASGPGVELVDAAETAEPTRVRIDRVPDTDWAIACAQLLTLIVGAHVTIENHPRLDDAAAGTARRPIGDRWRFDRKHATVSIASLEALTMAMWQYDHAQPDAAEPAVV